MSFPSSKTCGGFLSLLKIKSEALIIWCPSWFSTTNLCSYIPYSSFLAHSIPATKASFPTSQICSCLRTFELLFPVSQNAPPSRFTTSLLSLHAGIFTEALPKHPISPTIHLSPILLTFPSEHLGLRYIFICVLGLMWWVLWQWHVNRC